MKQLFLLSFFTLFVTTACISQTSVTVLRDTTAEKKDGLILSDGSIIWEGDQIKCGRGTLPNGDFKYIHTSPNSFINLMTVSNANPTGSAYTPIGRSYSGLLLDVKKIQKLGSKKRGYKYYLKVGGGNIVNYMCEIEDALYTGEIVSKGPAVTTQQ